MAAEVQVGLKRKVIFSYARMFGYAIGIIFLATVIARTLDAFYPLSGTCIHMFEYVGYIGWVLSLGSLGWEIQTWDGNTPPEQLNHNLAKIFSLVGVFAFVLARELIPATLSA